jgi:hypothetical protein
MSDRVLIFLSAAFIVLAVWGGEPLSSVVDPFLQSLNRISAPAHDQERASNLQAPYPPPVYNRNRRLFLPLINNN